jgi:hypothetical protein
VKTWFQSLAFTFNLYRYSEEAGKGTTARAGKAPGGRSSVDGELFVPLVLDAA